MITQDFRFRGKHHRIAYFTGRRHVIFTGKVTRSMRVWQWAESVECHKEIFESVPRKRVGIVITMVAAYPPPNRKDNS